MSQQQVFRAGTVIVELVDDYYRLYVETPQGKLTVGVEAPTPAFDVAQWVSDSLLRRLRFLDQEIEVQNKNICQNMAERRILDAALQRVKWDKTRES